MPFGLFSGFSNQGTAIIDPSSIFESNLVAWYRGDSLVNSSGKVATWTDKSGNGNNLTQSTGGDQPTYNSSSATFNSYPSATFNGTTSLMSSGVIVGGGAGSIWYAFVVMKATSQTGNVVAIILSFTDAASTDFYLKLNGTTNAEPGSLFLSYSSTGGGSQNGAAGTMNWGFPAASLSWSGLVVGGSTPQTYLNEDNLDNLNVGLTGATSPNWTGVLINLGGLNAANYTQMEVAEVVICDVQPTSKQNTQLFRYAQNRYNVDPALSTTAITNVSTAGGTARISGTGFNSTTTVSNTTLGNLTVKYVNADVIEITIPAATAGSYDISITNTNTGLTYTRNSFIQVQSSATYDPMVIMGIECIGWWQANNVTTSSGSVSAIADQSLLSNTLSSVPITGSTAALTFSSPTVTLTGGSGFASTMTGAKITISNSTTGANDGTFTLTYISATSVSWTNASGAADASNAVHWSLNTQPTYNTTDSAFSNQPTMSFDGFVQYLQATINTDIAAISQLFVLVVGECTVSSSTPTYFCTYNATQFFLAMRSGEPFAGRGGNQVGYGPSELNVATNFTGWTAVGAGSPNTGTAASLTFSSPTVTLTGGSGFTSGMTGQTITITNSTTSANDGTFIFTYISSSSVSWTNASGAADSSGAVHWTIGLAGVSVDNTSTQTANVDIVAQTTNQLFALGAMTGGSDFITGKIAACVFCNAVPTSTQMSNLQTWAHGLFGT
jgi:hypothetical protein